MTQNKQNVREFVREIETLGRRFTDVNEQALINIFWNGLHKYLQTALLRRGLNPEHDNLVRLIKYAIHEEEAEERATKHQSSGRSRMEGEKYRPERNWGRFKSRVNGPRPFNTSVNDELSWQARHDNIRANAVSTNGRTFKRTERTERTEASGSKGRKPMDKGKRDRLRAEGWCFNCEEPGHEFRNCPRLHSMRPPQVRTGSVQFAWMERLAHQKEQADAYVGQVQVVPSDDKDSELTYEEVQEIKEYVHRLCEIAWGEDPLWHEEETRWLADYDVQVDDNEIVVCNRKSDDGRFVEFPRCLLRDLTFDLSRVSGESRGNRRPAPVPEGRSGHPENYKRWSWPAIRWLKEWLALELDVQDGTNRPEGVSKVGRIDVQPTMNGYSVQIDEADMFYNIRHEEVIDGDIKAEWVIEHLLSTRNIPLEDRGERFQDLRLMGFHTLMLNMTRIPGQSEPLRKRGSKRRLPQLEGVTLIEKTTMWVKDRSRRLPEPIVVNVKVNGHPIRALLDTGSMADFLSTTVTDQLRLEKEVYVKPLSVQLAVHGSRSKINCGTTVRLQYQSIDCERRFDIVNLDNYDAILGTPFLFQHQIAIGFNPSRVIVGSNNPV
jgi:hypothetical protein